MVLLSPIRSPIRSPLYRPSVGKWGGVPDEPMGAAFTDDFNRADGNLEDTPVSSSGGIWEHDGLVAGAAGISGNNLGMQTAEPVGSAYKCTDQGSADHYVQFTVGATGNAGSFVCNRLTDVNNWVGMRTGFGQIHVYRKVVTTFTSLHNSEQGVVAGSVIRLECVGTTWTVFHNDGQVATGEIGDASLTSTRQGIVPRVIVNNNWVDNFEAGAL